CQDRTLWDKSHIERGNYYLVNATNTNEITKYHLEAGIAYWHTTPTNQNKWHHILQLYNKLITIEYSPITALHRTFALAKVYGYKEGIFEAEKLQLNENSYYHQLLGNLYADINIKEAIAHYNHAITLTKSKAEKRILQKELDRLKEK